MHPRREQHGCWKPFAHVLDLTLPLWRFCHQIGVVLSVHWVADRGDGVADVESTVNELGLLSRREFRERWDYGDAEGVSDLILRFL